MKGRVRTAIAALGCLSAAGCATRSLNGLYCAPFEGDPPRRLCEFLVDTPDGIWVADRTGARLADRDALSLARPARRNDPWQLDIGVRLSQTTDPVLDLMLSKLDGRHIFYKLNQTGVDRRSMLVIDDGLYIHTERAYSVFPWECLAGILTYVQDGPPSPPDRVAQPPPWHPGWIERWIDVLGVEHGPGSCPKTLDPAGYNSARNLLGVARIYLRANGSIKGVKIYDRSGFYVAADVSETEIRHLIAGLDLFPPSRGL